MSTKHKDRTKDPYWLWKAYKRWRFSTKPRFTFPPDHVGGGGVTYTDYPGDGTTREIEIRTCVDSLEISILITKHKNRKEKFICVELPLHIVAKLREDIEERYFMEDHSGWQKLAKTLPPVLQEK